MAKRYWLFKSEPGAYSIEDLARDRKTFWHGVRNYQARNLLRDEIREGDGVLFYHSSCDPQAVVGTAKVVRNGYPDPTQFDKKSEYHDPDSTTDEPRWFVVDIAFESRLPRPITLAEIKTTPALAGMMLVKRGARLSVQPVSDAEWQCILNLAAKKG